MGAGQAEPPITTRFNVSMRAPVASICCNNIIQTVGTAAEKFTRAWVMISCTEAPSNLAPGRISVAPAMGAEIGKDQPLAWNIGTTGMTRSATPSPRQST